MIRQMVWVNRKMAKRKWSSVIVQHLPCHFSYMHHFGRLSLNLVQPLHLSCFATFHSPSKTVPRSVAKIMRTAGHNQPACHFLTYSYVYGQSASMQVYHSGIALDALHTLFLDMLNNRRYVIYTNKYRV